jgi:hypothetical protein
MFIDNVRATAHEVLPLIKPLPIRNKATKMAMASLLAYYLTLPKEARVLGERMTHGEWTSICSKIWGMDFKVDTIKGALALGSKLVVEGQKFLVSSRAAKFSGEANRLTFTDKAVLFWCPELKPFFDRDNSPDGEPFQPHGEGSSPCPPKKDSSFLQEKKNNHVLGAEPLQPVLTSVSTGKDDSSQTLQLSLTSQADLGQSVLVSQAALSSLGAKLELNIQATLQLEATQSKILYFMEHPVSGSSALQPQYQGEPALQQAPQPVPMPHDDLIPTEADLAAANQKSPEALKEQFESDLLVGLTKKVQGELNIVCKIYPEHTIKTWGSSPRAFQVAAAKFRSNNKFYPGSASGLEDKEFCKESPAVWTTWTTQTPAYLRELLSPRDKLEIEALRADLKIAMPNASDEDIFGTDDWDLLALWRWLYWVGSSRDSSWTFQKAKNRYLGYLKAFRDKMPEAKMQYFMMRGGTKADHQNVIQSKMASFMITINTPYFLKAMTKDYKDLVKVCKKTKAPKTAEEKKAEADARAQAKNVKEERRLQDIAKTKAALATVPEDPKEAEIHRVRVAKLNAFVKLAVSTPKETSPVVLTPGKAGEEYADFLDAVRYDISQVYQELEKYASLYSLGYAESVNAIRDFWMTAFEMGPKAFSGGDFIASRSQPKPTVLFLLKQCTNPTGSDSYVNPVQLIVHEIRRKAGTK